ncbi:MAG: alanine--tRNA ligase [Candidatus Altiarchaeota archaeon]
MAFDFRRLKQEKKPEFAKNYGKYYPVGSLESIGFKRSVCSKCGRGFWSLEEREYCDEPTCSGGYRFIGEKLTRKPFKYKEAWDEYVKTFRQWDYVPLKRYPVVCRWYEDLYFVNAGVNDFQPYVVAGEVEPPAPAVLEPQFCLRFQDMDSVGVTGRHYTGFIMVGQHTFNTKDRHVYFKDEGILQMHEFLTKGLGIHPREIFYHEDVWAGGGNYGPSMEFFSRGLELGNQVYMQYEVLPDGGGRELKTKVIDMGAGLERWSWFSQGAPMSYDTVFPEVMKYLRRASGFNVDDKFAKTFGGYSGMLDIDEVDDINSVWGEIAGRMSMELPDLKRRVYEMRALYAIADHTRSLLVAIHDGALPSNVGGGYNLRTILRRCWALIDEFGYDIDLEKVFDIHVKEFGSWYTELREKGSLYDILDVEGRRYKETREKGRRMIERIIESGEGINAERMVELYDSQGITPDVVSEMAGVEVPDNFYALVEERHEKNKAQEEKQRLPETDKIPETIPLYYEDVEEVEFKAKILKILDGYVILDKTHFYPEGGGQEADHGHIGNARVFDVQKSGNVVLHKVDDTSRIREGSEVHCNVDVERRRQLMQHHTATHIVNAAARKVLGPHIWQAGAHKSVEMSRLDVTHYKGVGGGELKAIEDEAGRIVDAGIEVEHLVLKRNEAEERFGFRLYQGGAVPGTELRVINIRDVDAEACGGTHLHNTSEVGKIKMVSAKRIQDGVVRLEFKAGAASERQSSEEEELFSEILGRLSVIEVTDTGYGKEQLVSSAKALNVPQDQLLQSIERFISEVTADRDKLIDMGENLPEFRTSENMSDAVTQLFDVWKKQKKMLEKILEDKAGGMEEGVEGKFAGGKTVKHVVEGMSVKALSEAAKSIVGREEGRLLIIVNKSGDKVNVVVASKSKYNAGDVCKRLCALLGGGGGGSPTLAIGGGNTKGLEKILKEFKP